MCIMYSTRLHAEYNHFLPADAKIYQGGLLCSLAALPRSVVLHIIYVILLFTETDTQLYFTWRGSRYEPGDSILITDVGVHYGDAGPGDSLVCVTTDVNTQCCTDAGGVGEWFFPNGSMVLGNIDDPNQNSLIIRTGCANQVRLNFRTQQTSPTGEYTCVVPETGSLVIQTAGIRLVTGTYMVIVYLSMSELVVKVLGSDVRSLCSLLSRNLITVNPTIYNHELMHTLINSCKNSIKYILKHHRTP